MSSFILPANDITAGGARDNRATFRAMDVVRARALKQHNHRKALSQNKFDNKKASQRPTSSSPSSVHLNPPAARVGFADGGAGVLYGF